MKLVLGYRSISALIRRFSQQFLNTGAFFSGLIYLFLNFGILRIKGKHTFHIAVASEILVDKILVVHQRQIISRSSSGSIGYTGATFDGFGDRGFTCTVVSKEEIYIGWLDIGRAVLIACVCQIDTNYF